MHQSAGEAKRYDELLFWERQGLIRNLRCQGPTYRLEINGVEIASYIPDATYEVVDLPGFALGTFVVEDHKSVWTRDDPVYKIKRRLMKAIHSIDVMEHMAQRKEYRRSA
jgi:hypothetical protein